MPSIKELMTPQNVGIMIYSELMPIPAGMRGQAEKAEKAFELLGLGGTVPVSAVRPAPGESEKTSRGRGAPAMNEAIVGYLSTDPLMMRTPTQILRGIKTSRPNLKIEALQARLKRDAGKPGLWIVAGGKYGMPGAEAKTSPTKANASTTEVNTNVEPAPGAAPGEKLQPRVYAYIEAHPGYTKAQVIGAFKASPTPARENHVGIAIGRLRTSKKITDAEDGPYWALRAAKPIAPGDGVGAAAQPAA